MIRFLLCAAMIAAPLPAMAKDYPVRIKRVKDGDTVELKRRVFGKPVSIRITSSTGGIDTPESDGGCAAERDAAARAKAFTERMVAAAGWVAAAKTVKVDKYGGRYDAQLILIIDGQSVNLGDAIIAAGLALPYSGGKRVNWCSILPLPLDRILL